MKAPADFKLYSNYERAGGCVKDVPVLHEHKNSHPASKCQEGVTRVGSAREGQRTTGLLRSMGSGELETSGIWGELHLERMTQSHEAPQYGRVGLHAASAPLLKHLLWKARVQEGSPFCSASIITFQGAQLILHTE